LKANTSKLVYSVPALEKGLDILEALARARSPLALTGIAHKLGRNPSEIFRMLDCLTQRGYLQRDATSGDYRLSLRLFELAHTHSPLEELRRAARRPMEQLAYKLGESCHLSVRRLLDLVVVDQAFSQARVCISVEPGSHFPLALTASGQLLLAHDPEAGLLVKKLPRLQRSHVSKAKLAAIRRQGYCLHVEETTRGVIGLAVLVGKPQIQNVCALTVSALRSSKPREFLKKTLPVLQRTARQIQIDAGLFL